MARNQDAPALPPGPDPALKRRERFVGTWEPVRLDIADDRRAGCRWRIEMVFPQLTKGWVRAVG